MHTANDSFEPCLIRKTLKLVPGDLLAAQNDYHVITAFGEMWEDNENISCEKETYFLYLGQVFHKYVEFSKFLHGDKIILTKAYSENYVRSVFTKIN